MKTALLIANLLITACISHAQITKLNSNKSLNEGFPLSSTKSIYLSALDETLWVTDATVAGTVQLSSTIKYVKGGTILNNKLIFTGTTPTTGGELYISDGTVAGTQLLKDIVPGAGGSVPDDDNAILNGELYFTAETAAEGRELWKTNGTAAGTVLVKDIVSGTEGSNVVNGYNMFSNGSFILLNIKTAAEGNELWKSDGTAAGTVSLKNINPGVASSDAAYFYKHNNIVLFAAKQSGLGIELWKTDGTTAGTQLVKEFNPGEADGVEFLFFYPFNNKLFFKAKTATEGDEIWSTDGTTANTTLLKDIEPGPGGSFSSLFSIATVGSKIIFSAFNTASGFELWESDGTTAGTKLFKDINPGVDNSTAFILPSFTLNNGSLNQTLWNGKFFIAASTDTEGSELWVSDGTPAGTVRVKDINPGVEDGIETFSYLYTTSGLYFAANDGVNGNQLWKSDGTEAGTMMVANINPGADAEITFSFFFVNNKALFEATDGDHVSASDLYRIDLDLSPLPVRLFDFNVKSQQANAVLNWSTLSELNSKDFTVQRSIDGRNFTTIGTVQAMGNSNNKHTYQYNDLGILSAGSEVFYYRILINDKDGKTETSKTISLKTKGNRDWTITLQTNPVQSEIKFQLNNVNNPVNISVKDITGKTIIQKSAGNANGLMTIEAGNLAPGVYVLLAESNSDRKVLRFVKQ